MPKSVKSIKFPKTHKYYFSAYVVDRDGRSQAHIWKDGERVRKSLRMPFSNQLKHLLLDKTEKLADEVFGEVQTPVTFGELYDLYFDASVKYSSDNTQKLYAYMLDKIGRNTLIENASDKLLKTDLSIKSKNTYGSMINAIVNYANEKGVTSLKKQYFGIKEKEKEVVIADYDKIKDLPEPFQSIAYLQATTGLRFKETQDSKVVKDEIIVKGKGSRIRKFPIKAFPECEPYLNTLGNKAILVTYNYYLNRVLGSSSHSLRKYFLHYNRLNRDIPIDIMAQLMGHSIRVMEKYYLKDKTSDEIVKLIKKRV